MRSHENRRRNNNDGKGEGSENKPDNANNARSNYNNNSGNGNGNNSGNNNGRQRTNKARTKKVNYPPHAALRSCLERYAADDPALIRGKLRVMPSKHGASFVTCDRGSQLKDVLVKDEKDRNRGLDGEFVFVELVPGGEYGEGVGNGKGADEKRHDGKEMKIADFMSNLELNDADVANGGSKKKSDKVAEKEDDEEDLEEDVQFEEEEYLIGEEEEEEEASVPEENMDTIDDEEVEMWHDDEAQMSLWDPVVNLRKRSNKSTTNQQQNEKALSGQRSGKVIYILPPKSTAGQQQSELTSEGESSRNGNGNNKQQVLPKRTIVGTLTQLPNGGRCLLSPNNKSLPQFMCPSGTKPEDNSNNETTDGGKAFASKT